MNAPPPRPCHPLEALAGSWLELWRQSAAWGPGGLVAVSLWLDARQRQRQWLTALSRATDQLLRSPATLTVTQQVVSALGGGTNPPAVPPR